MVVVFAVEEANRRNEVREAVRGAAMLTSARRDVFIGVAGSCQDPRD